MFHSWLNGYSILQYLIIVRYPTYNVHRFENYKNAQNKNETNYQLLISVTKGGL